MMKLILLVLILVTVSSVNCGPYYSFPTSFNGFCDIAISCSPAQQGSAPGCYFTAPNGCSDPYYFAGYNIFVSISVNWGDNPVFADSTTNVLYYNYHYFFSNLDSGYPVAVSSDLIPTYYYAGVATVTITKMDTNYNYQNYPYYYYNYDVPITTTFVVENVPSILTHLDPATFTIPIGANLPDFNFTFYDPGYESSYYFSLYDPVTHSYSDVSYTTLYSNTLGYHNSSYLTIFSESTVQVFYTSGTYFFKFCIADYETFFYQTFGYVGECITITIYVVDVIEARLIKENNNPLIVMEGGYYPGGDKYCYNGALNPDVYVQWDTISQLEGTSVHLFNSASSQPGYYVLNGDCFSLPSSSPVIYPDGPANDRAKFDFYISEGGNPVWYGESFTEIRVINVAPTITIISPVSSANTPIVVNAGVPFQNPISFTISDPSSADMAAGFTLAYTLPTGRIVNLAQEFSNTGTFTPNIEFLYGGAVTLYVYATDKDGGVSQGTPIYFFVNSIL